MSCWQELDSPWRNTINEQVITRLQKRDRMRIIMIQSGIEQFEQVSTVSRLLHDWVGGVVEPGRGEGLSTEYSSGMLYGLVANRVSELHPLEDRKT